MLFDKLFAFKRQGKSANICKDRLQIIIAHERRHREESPELMRLRNEIMELVRRFYNMPSNEDIEVVMEKQEEQDILALNIQIPARTTETAINT